MISSNTDLYETIRALSQKLRSSGEAEWSSNLDDALSISSLAGEVLGETRLRLSALRDTDIPARLGVKWQIDDALSYLNHVLGPPPAHVFREGDAEN